MMMLTIDESDALNRRVSAIAGMIQALPSIVEPGDARASVAELLREIEALQIMVNALEERLRAS
jgi:vacuolar-type H+-ATPase subunit D/Vma8